jgi:tetratricopeptide (TPR) repeat protein
VLSVGVDCPPSALRAAVTGAEGDIERVDGNLVAVFGSLAGALAAATEAERRAAGQRAPRIGIAHGEVVRRAGVLEGAAVEEAVSLAARAERGQVLVGDAVELLAGGGHRFARRPGAAAELQWEGQAGVPMPAGLLAATRRGACVGRRSELELVLRDLDAVRVGDRRVVLLTGEPGIGKTRLAAEAGLAAHARGAIVLYGRSDEGMAVPYQAVAEALDHLISTAPPGLVEPAGPALGKLASLVPAARERAGEADVADDGHGGERYVLFGGVGAVLSAASARQPVVLVLDDLHWADVPTVLLMHHLLALPGRPRLLVIATCRPVEMTEGSELSASLAQLRRDDRATEIALGGLGEGDVLDLVQELAGEELEEGERAFARALHRETDGNPLFVSEVIRGLGGRNEIAAAAAALGRGSGAKALAAPASLRELIVARVAALGAETLAVLEAAAVVGREFDAGLLTRVAHVDHERLADILDGAERAALIVPAAGGPGRFAFHHLLIGHTLYEHLGAARRARLHRRVAEALEELTGDAAGARAGEIARHWAEASPPDRDRALRWAELAGRHALREIDPDAALRWLGQALELHGPADDARRCSLLIALGVAQRKHGDARFRETLLEAARLGRRLEEPKLLVRAAIENTRGFVSDAGDVDTERVAMLEAALEAVGPEDSRERAVLLGMLAFELSFAPDREPRVALADEALAVARRLGDERTLCYVLGARSMPIWAPETLDERLACTAESVRLADGLGDPLARFHALHWRGVALVQTGEMEELRRVVRRQHDLAERLGEPSARWLTLYDEATVAAIGGRLADAEVLASEALEIATDSGQPDALSLYASQLTNIRYEQGRLAELQQMIAETAADNPGIPSFRALLALAYLEGELPLEAAELLAAERIDVLPRDMTWLACAVLWTFVCASVGDAARAESLYALLRPYEDQVVYTGISAWGDVDHALGRLATVAGRHDLAELHLGRSIARYIAIGAPIWLARATLDQASLLLAREGPGDRERARELLRRAQVDARRLGAAGIERRAAVLLGHERATSVMSAPALKTAAAPPPAGDTRRAGLVREGELWTLTHGGASFHLKHSKGMGYLARLLGDPHTEVHVVELQAGAPVPELRAEADAGGAWLDEEAKRAYRERLVQLEDDLEEAERWGDVERAARAREERELIGRELARAVGLGGRDRPAGSAAERARVNTTRAIRGAIRRIEECDPSLGRHLDRAVRTGTFCAYDPSPQDEVTWTMNIVQPEGTPS